MKQFHDAKVFNTRLPSFVISKNYGSLTHETRIKDAVNMEDLICLLATVRTLNGTEISQTGDSSLFQSRIIFIPKGLYLEVEGLLFWRFLFQRVISLKKSQSSFRILFLSRLESEPFGTITLQDIELNPSDNRAYAIPKKKYGLNCILLRRWDL